MNHEVAMNIDKFTYGDSLGKSMVCHYCGPSITGRCFIVNTMADVLDITINSRSNISDKFRNQQDWVHSLDFQTKNTKYSTFMAKGMYPKGRFPNCQQQLSADSPRLTGISNMFNWAVT